MANRDLSPPKRGWMISKVNLDHHVKQRLTGSGSISAQLSAAAKARGYSLSERTARDVLRCERPFEQATLDAVAAALNVPAYGLVAAESDSVVDLLQPRRLQGLNPSAAIDLVRYASAFFGPQLSLVHLGFPPADDDRPNGRLFAGSRPRRTGYGLFRIRYRVPVFSGIVSCAVGQGTFTLWIDYGSITAEGTRATSHESWFPAASRKRRGRLMQVANEVAFLTWLDDFPTTFMLRCNDPDVVIAQEPEPVSPEEGEDLLHRSDAPVVGFERTIHGVPFGKNPA